MLDKKLLFRMIRPDEHSEIVSFLLKHFTPRLEILNKYFAKNSHRIDETEKKLIAEDMKDRYADLVSRYFGHVAIDKETKKIIAMTLLAEKKNPKFYGATDNNKEPIDSPGPVTIRSKVYADFIHYVMDPVEDISDIFSEFPMHPAFIDYDVLCVDPNYSVRGLGTRLSHEVYSLAESKGIGLIYSCCISPFSQKILAKHGFKTFQTISTLSFRDKDGNFVYKGTEPSVIAKMVRLSQSTSLDGKNEKKSS